MRTNEPWLLEILVWKLAAFLPIPKSCYKPILALRYRCIGLSQVPLIGHLSLQMKLLYLFQVFIHSSDTDGRALLGRFQTKTQDLQSDDQEVKVQVYINQFFFLRMP